MKLHSPFIITSRLLPGLEIGGATIQLEYAAKGMGGRTRYRWAIDLPDGQEFTNYDLQSGCQGGNLQEGFQSLLSFLSACGESVNYARRTGREGENADLFPEPIAQWASQCSDELSIASLILEETPNLIEE